MTAPTMPGTLTAYLRARPELVALFLILALAAAVRVVWVLYAARLPQELHDPLFYFLYAQQIADGNGYRLLDGSPTAYYPVGYAAALGGVFALVEHTPIPDNLVRAAAFFNVALGVGTVSLAYELSRRLFGVAVALLAALWIAVFPNLVFHTGTYLTETLFNFLVLAALLIILGAGWRDGRIAPARLVVFGIVLGLSVIVRPISLLFLPLLAVAWFVAGFGWRRALGYTAVATVTMAAVVAPWSVRNFVVMDAPVLMSTNLGDDLCMGHHPNATGHFALPEHCFAGYDHLERPEFEVTRNNENIEKAVRFAANHPVAELKLVFKKARWTYDHDHDGLWAAESYGDDPFIDPSLRTALERVADRFFFVTLGLGGLGALALLTPRREPRRFFFLLALLSLALIPLAFFGDARFHVPAVPLLSITAAWLVVAAARFAPRLIARPVTSGEEVAEREAPVPEHDAL